jgi:16S rRNA (uracil1498-N3)-methyltransferase
LLPRVYLPLVPAGETLAVAGADARHLALSLRMRPGEGFTACDGLGREASCVIESLSKDAVLARVVSVGDTRSEPRVRVTLCLALSKADKLEWALQKGTELGAAAFVPFYSERCVSKPSDASHKLERWQRIVREAAAQSGRGVLPEVREPVAFTQALALTAGLPRYLCHEEAGTRLTEAFTPAAQCAVFTGPEGGFSPGEVAYAEAAGASRVWLGPRVLRCETAPVAALTAILTISGEM